MALTPYASFCGFPPTIVMNVKLYTIKIKKTLPRASQNSASPYHFTTKALMQLRSALVKRGRYLLVERYSQVRDDTDRNDSSDRDLVAPVCQDQIQRRNLEGDQERFVEKEVPSDPKADRLIDPMSSHADKSTGNGHVRCHLGHRVVDQAKHARIESVR
jgi:hypothetical protein